MMNSRQPAERRDRWIALLVVSAATAATVPLYGYAFGLHNHSIQIPLLNSLHDPSLYPADPLVRAMLGYFSVFWPAMAMITRGLPLEPTFFSGHLLATAAFYAAVWSIARRAFPGDLRAALLAVGLVLFGESVVGEESLHWFYFSHTPVATAMGAWALCLAMQGRWIVSLALTGLVFDVHAMQAAYVLLMIGAAALSDLRRAIRPLAVGAIAFALTAAPGVFWMVRSSALGSPDDLASLLRAYFPFHFFASSFRPDEWVGLAATLALLVSAWIAAPRTTSADRIRLMTAAIIVLWMVGGGLAEWRPFPLLLKLHVFRASSYLCVLTLVLLAGWLSAMWTRSQTGWLPPASVAAMTIVLAIGGATRWLAVGATLPLVWATGRSIVGALIAIAIAGGLLATFWRLRWPDPLESLPVLHARQIYGRLVTGVVAAAASLTLWGRLRHVATLATIGALGWLAFESQRGRAADVHQRIAAYESWFDVQRWAGANTNPEDLFLTPPDCEGFRVYSHRPVVGEWKDGAAVLWDREYAAYWRDWYVAVGGDFDAAEDVIWRRLARSWYAMGQRGIEAVARHYRADYIVLRRPGLLDRAAGSNLRWDGPILYDNGRYFVVRAPASAPPPASTGRPSV